MIQLTEEQFKEYIEAAHRAGQHNQRHCDPSAYEAMVYYEKQVKNCVIADISGSTSVKLENAKHEVKNGREECHCLNPNPEASIYDYVYCMDCNGILLDEKYYR